MIEHAAFRRLAWISVGLCLIVIVVGAYVRLSDAGLGCPDWPGCYGHITWPHKEGDVAVANAAFPERAVEIHKAGKEMLHRFLAGGLGVVILVLAWMGTAGSKIGRRAVALSVLMTLAAIALDRFDWHLVAMCAAALAIAAPIFAALSMNASRARRVALATLGLVIFQAMLGMWTVTLQLKPIVVTAHLLGGLSTGGLLLWAALHARPIRALRVSRLWVVSAIVLLSMQIFLGGWTSTNYAALSCPDFPTCVGQWLPDGGFGEGFILFREIGVNYEGGILDAAARAAIHWTHRAGAVVVLLILGGLGIRLLAADADRRLGIALLLLLGTQIGLGIANVYLRLPLSVATLHNAFAALLLGCSLIVLARALADRRNTWNAGANMA